MDDQLDGLAMNNMIVSVPLVFIFFLAVVSLGYILLSNLSARGKDQEEKYLPYTGGQKISSGDPQLSYQTFFRLGLLFGVVHVAALVLATLPLNWHEHQIGLIYLAGIAISAFALARTKSV